MRLSRLIAFSLGSLTIGLAYYLSISEPMLTIFSSMVYGVGAAMILLAILFGNSRHWRLYSICFIGFGIVMVGFAATSFVLHFPIGIALLIVVVGSMSVGGWFSIEQAKRRHRMKRLNSNYLREV